LPPSPIGLGYPKLVPDPPRLPYTPQPAVPAVVSPLVPLAQAQAMPTTPIPTTKEPSPSGHPVPTAVHPKRSPEPLHSSLYPAPEDPLRPCRAFGESPPERSSVELLPWRFSQGLFQSSPFIYPPGYEIPGFCVQVNRVGK